MESAEDDAKERKGVEIVPMCEVEAVAEVAGLADGDLDVAGLDVDKGDDNENQGSDEQKNQRNEEFAIGGGDGFYAGDDFFHRLKNGADDRA